MATELQNTSLTVEPSILRPDRGVADPFPKSRSLTRRLEAALAGRVLLTCVRWLVVFGFISCGFFGAAAVHSSVRQTSPTQHQILAASGAQE